MPNMYKGRVNSSDINKWRLEQLSKLDQLYINSVSTRTLQGSKIYFVK